MKINGQYYRSVWTEGREPSCVHIFDQRLFPFETKILSLSSAEEVAEAIASMKVRGAPLIGAVAAWGMYLACLKYHLMQDIYSAAEILKSARPTAIDLAKGVNCVLDSVKNCEKKTERIEIALKTAETFTDKSADQCRQIGEFGLKIIREKLKADGSPINILTHCNAGWLATVDYGTATAPIYLAHENGLAVHVWVDETRPRNQGANLTAFELGQHGISHTVIADNTGGHLMQHGMVDLVIVGTDRTTRQGDVANKIGTYLKALAAFDNQIPFYVAVPSSSIDFEIADGIRDIPIERRDEDEVHYVSGLTGTGIEKVRITPKNSPAMNYAFDVTPARLITGLITERGICRASEEDILSLFYEYR